MTDYAGIREQLVDSALDHVAARIHALLDGDHEEAEFHKRQHEQAMVALESLSGGEQ